ncbi:MAG: hypothetical protein NT027_08715 [Proteobacteria bacterium]|nr:hypothetical protein [Pseudomonadota bacterium]
MKFSTKANLAAFLLTLSADLGHAQTVSSYLDKLKNRVEYAIEHDTHIIQFSKGSSAISTSELQKLQDYIGFARQNTCVKQIVLASWSDSNYPIKNGESLDADSQKLANERGQATKLALEKMGINDVESHSMAVHPSWISNLFNTNDSVLKGETTVSSRSDEVIANAGKLLQNAGGPSKVVVLVKTHVKY